MRWLWKLLGVRRWRQLRRDPLFPSVRRGSCEVGCVCGGAHRVPLVQVFGVWTCKACFAEQHAAYALGCRSIPPTGEEARSNDE